MFAPDGCHSWKTILENLRETSGQILKLVALEHSATKTESKDSTRVVAELCLINEGFADNYREAELVISIVTVFLMVNLLEYFPPVVANVAGNRLTLDWPAYSHKDQFECCSFQWPIKTDPQFQALFEYSQKGAFNSDELLDRFCFIDPETGKLVVKNGAEFHLINGLGLSDEFAKKYQDFINTLSGYYLFWSEVPDEEEYRELLSCLEVNDDFTKALNTIFGTLGSPAEIQSENGKVGRPKLRGEIAHAYSTMFPSGHVVQGLTWKVVALRLSETMGRTVTVATIRRGLRELVEQK
jgi:hypothetical protein